MGRVSLADPSATLTGARPRTRPSVAPTPVPSLGLHPPPAGGGRGSSRHPQAREGGAEAASGKAWPGRASPGAPALGAAGRAAGRAAAAEAAPKEVIWSTGLTSERESGLGRPLLARATGSASPARFGRGAPDGSGALPPFPRLRNGHVRRLGASGGRGHGLRGALGVRHPGAPTPLAPAAP